LKAQHIQKCEETEFMIKLETKSKTSRRLEIEYMWTISKTIYVSKVLGAKKPIKDTSFKQEIMKLHDGIRKNKAL